MKWNAFIEKYPGLAGELAGYFHESETVDDESNARNLRRDLSAGDRINLLRELLEDASKLTVNMDDDWEIMIEMANRRIYNVTDARAWLRSVMLAWQEELTRLQGNDPRA